VKNIKVTIYTKGIGRVDLHEQEYHDFDFDSVIKHRTDGPAVIWYYEDGSVWREHYCVNHKYHRLDGPAMIYYYAGGSVNYSDYYINNKSYNKEEYDNLINEMKALPKSLKLIHEDWWVREL